LELVKLDYQVEKKNVELINRYNELIELAEENEIEERISRIKRILQQRMPKLRHNVERSELKKMIEHKVKQRNQNEVTQNRVTTKCNLVWFLASKMYDELKEGDKKIENLMSGIENALKKAAKLLGLSRRSAQNETVLTANQIVELNNLLQNQLNLLQTQNKEVNAAFDDLADFSRTGNFQQLESKTKELHKEFIEKDDLLTTKYSRMGTTFKELNNIQHEAEEMKVQLKAAKTESHFSDVTGVTKASEGIFDCKVDLEEKGKKISELERSVKKWTILAYTCKSSFSHWFHSGCNF
jgi:hypothetical protein